MSRKRTKSESGLLQDEGGSAMGEPRSGAEGFPELHSGISYASILRNGADDAMADVDLELTDADFCFTSGKEGEGVCFSEHAHEVLMNSWRSAAVVRLMGKPNSVNSFDFMLRALRRKWRSRGGWKLVDLLNDWFVVKFELEEDMEDVLCGGPWIIAGQTLVVRRWSASFNPVNDEIGSMAVWARIVGLPVMYFNDFAMQKIGSLLGEVVKVDSVTLGQDRGRFARCCVEMDLSKPFRSSVLVDNICYKVQYEGLSMLCFTCGIYGHSKEKCPAGADVSGACCEEQADVRNLGANDGEKAADCVDVMGGEMDKRSSNEETGLFGPWMLVNSRDRRKSAKEKSGSLPAHGSRFQVLLQEEAVEAQVGVPGPGMEVEVDRGMRKSNGDAGKVWTFLQNKIKEGNGTGASLVMENGNGAYLLPQESPVAPSVVQKGVVGPRLPLVDLSNAGGAKGKGPVKLPRKVNSEGLKSSGRLAQRMPFPNSGGISSSNFAGFFGRCPPEESVSVDCCVDAEKGSSGNGIGSPKCASAAGSEGPVLGLVSDV